MDAAVPYSELSAATMNNFATLFKVLRRQELRRGFTVRSAPGKPTGWTVGYETSVPVYCSESGKVVTKDDAMQEIVEIVPTSGLGRSENDYEASVIELCTLLSYDPAPGHGPDGYDSSLAENASAALDQMAEENPSLQYRIGLEGLKSPWACINKWAIEKLGNLRRREAVEPLKKVVEEYSSRPALSDLSAAASRALQKIGAES